VNGERVIVQEISTKQNTYLNTTEQHTPAHHPYIGHHRAS